MKYSDIIKRNRELSSQITSTPYRIGVLSNITVSHIKDILELSLREEGINAEVVTGDYDSIVQDSVKFASFDAVIIFWEAGNFVNGMHNKADNLSSNDYEELSMRLEAEITLVLGNLKDSPLVLINKFSSNFFDSNPLKTTALSSLCYRLNNTLAETKLQNHIVVDIDQILGDLGHDKSVDYRQFQQSKSLYKLEFFKSYTSAIKPAFLSALGLAKKILVLDCDNTLWGGVVGEDGVKEIVLAENDPKGISFSEAQTLIKGFRDDGVLLALCSKNNADDVDEVFKSNPEMILKNDDFVSKKVNWNDKASNIEQIARELNIGLDSFIFVDDSSFEIGLVKEALPEVLCFQVPENLSEYPSLIRKLKPFFFNLSNTDEDSQKTKLYQQEDQRKAEHRSFTTVEDYLASLELKLEVKRNFDIPIPRVAQMTQKTNQFNLTTKRYTEADIRHMLENNFFEIASFELSDRFGEYGTTGLAIIKLDDKKEHGSALIDTFLMSCRVIGRNVEYQFFAEIIKILKKENIHKIEAYFLPTLKNQQVSSFYDDLGFGVISSKTGKKNYSLNLLDFTPKEIPYIT